MSEGLDLNQAIEQVQQMLSSKEGEAQIQNLLGMLAGGESGENDKGTEQSQNEGGFNPADLLSGMSDIETIMKIQKIMSVFGNQKDDTNTAFLNSLKPFLKKERQKKVEQAAKLMSVAKVIKVFKDSGIGGV